MRLVHVTEEQQHWEGVVSEPDPRKNGIGGSGKWDGVEVYTASGMQAHFRLAFANLMCDYWKC